MSSLRSFSDNIEQLKTLMYDNQLGNYPEDIALDLSDVDAIKDITEKSELYYKLLGDGELAYPDRSVWFLSKGNVYGPWRIHALMLDICWVKAGNDIYECDYMDLFSTPQAAQICSH